MHCWHLFIIINFKPALTIFTIRCASLTLSCSNITSSSSVGYNGNCFDINCSIR